MSTMLTVDARGEKGAALAADAEKSGIILPPLEPSTAENLTSVFDEPEDPAKHKRMRDLLPEALMRIIGGSTSE